jgi:hypothetical protein
MVLKRVRSFIDIKSFTIIKTRINITKHNLNPSTLTITRSFFIKTLFLQFFILYIVNNNTKVSIFSLTSRRAFVIYNNIVIVQNSHIDDSSIFCFLVNFHTSHNPLDQRFWRVRSWLYILRQSFRQLRFRPKQVLLPLQLALLFCRCLT